MTPLQWTKVFADLRTSKTRSALVVLSIAVGVMAIGFIAGAQHALLQNMQEQFSSSHPAHATLYSVDTFDQDFVEATRSSRGIEEADGRRTLDLRVRSVKDSTSSAWQSCSLTAVPDYTDMRVRQITLLEGTWPPPDNSVLLERSSLPLIHARTGDWITVQTTDGKERRLRVVGSVHDIDEVPSFFTGTVNGYINLNTLEALGEGRDLDTLLLRVSPPEDGSRLTKPEVQKQAKKIWDKIEKDGRGLRFMWVPEPGDHPVHDQLQTLLMLLGVLGAMSLFLSGFLVVNTVSSLLAQQVRQIGIMKALGASAFQITQMYLALVFIYGLLALGLGIPLGAVVAQAVAHYVGDLLNFQILHFEIPSWVLAMEVAVGVLLPVLTGWFPIRKGTQIRIREAITSYGIDDAPSARSWLDRAVHKIQFLPRPQLLSLRNLFRRKKRLALTLATLTMAGAIFMSVLSVRRSMSATTDDALAYFHYNIEVHFSKTYRSEQVEQAALEVPGVQKAESWGYSYVRLLRNESDDSDSENVRFLAPPSASELLEPTVVQGRWLLPQDENAIVINSAVQRLMPELQVGQDVTLRIRNQNTKWRLVGIVRSVMTGPLIYANRPHYALMTREAGRTRSVRLVLSEKDRGHEEAMAQKLEQHLRESGLRVQSLTTMGELRQRIMTQFDVMVGFLLLMAVLLAAVGGLGLMGTMSINVLERTKEFGVMRALGASHGTLMKIVIGEGMLLGLLSWALGLVLTVPISRVLSYHVGLGFTKSPLTYRFSWAGVLLWLVLVLLFSALSSAWPALRACRIRIRDALAYE